MKKYIWGDSELDRYVEEYTIKSDVGLEKGADYHLLPYAIQFEKAYLEFMYKLGRLTEDEYNNAVKILDELLVKESDLSKYEDMHSCIEDKVREAIGWSIYTCRSRNDIITAIERLYLREGLNTLISELYRLYKSLVKKARETGEIAAPAHTHYVLADSVPLNSYYTSYLEELDVVVSFIPPLYHILYTSPLGSGAIGGCPLKIDFTWLNERLGFRNQIISSIYGVNSRKTHNLLVIMLLSLITGLMARISRDIIKLSTQYNLLSLPEDFTTGSSQLIHKINPDVLELIIGLHTQISSIIHILNHHYAEESGYQRFLQHDKYLVIKYLRDVITSVRVLSSLIEKLKIKNTFNPPQNIKLTWLAHEISWKYNIEYRTLYNEIKKMLYEGHSIEKIIKVISQKNGIGIKEIEELAEEVFQRRYNNSFLSDIESLISSLEVKFSNFMVNDKA